MEGEGVCRAHATSVSAGGPFQSFTNAPAAPSTWHLEALAAPGAPELLTAVPIFQQFSVVDPAGWTLPREEWIHRVAVLTAVGRIACFPGVLGP